MGVTQNVVARAARLVIGHVRLFDLRSEHSNAMQASLSFGNEDRARTSGTLRSVFVPAREVRGPRSENDHS